MKVLQFTIPVAHDRTIIVQEDNMAHFYPYLHRHKEAQLIWIKEGEGTLVVDNNMHAFRKNDIYLLGANQPHLFKSNPEYFEEGSDLKIQALMIFFDPNGKLAPILALPEMQLLLSFLQQKQSGYKIPESHTESIIQRMLSVQYAKNQEVIIKFLDLLQTLYQIGNQGETLSTAKMASFSESEGIRIGNIFNYLMQHYERQISLEEVAAEAHMTPQAFCRYFKRHTRQTFVSFLNELRINEACKKLTSGKFENIATVVYTCGFNSVTNFNRVFKSVKGEAPKTYLNHYFKNLKV
ncbi:AraC family transcriptional regulator [Pedobacter boryungensis]|uniref:Helix-turn-helix transcriptional regulator n=1 Tax=Pedobacter boryungensis TaxID=869962 RepID=A0ABX2DAZ2_9SPHI|nr:AraC family transcriptional regulator [Pedobacter boryungensis]NQX30364.1 helix-turn-helix transcriptional regulator [Pedobacter boryungensis]